MRRLTCEFININYLMLLLVFVCLQYFKPGKTNMKPAKPSGVRQPKAPGLQESSKVSGSQLSIASTSASQQKGLMSAFLFIYLKHTLQHSLISQCLILRLDCILQLQQSAHHDSWRGFACSMGKWVSYGKKAELT